jgi:catechol 2,3-dioxygenase
MSASLQLTHIHLRVPDLARSVDFYTRLGFIVAERDAAHADLATAGNTPVLRLTEDRRATRAPSDAAGLFHAALLLPSRPALAGWLRFAAERRIEFDGFSDHGVSEAIYLSDPDGNGLEFYVDRPRQDWPQVNGTIEMTTKPLDIDGLLATAPTSMPTPLGGANWGHLHLRVTDLDRSEKFYREALGVEVTQRTYPGARFLAADGYHHHLGLNVWGHPHRPQPHGAPGLVAATFARRDAIVTRELRDPDGILVCVVAPND